MLLLLCLLLVFPQKQFLEMAFWVRGCMFAKLLSTRAVWTHIPGRAPPGHPRPELFHINAWGVIADSRVVVRNNTETSMYPLLRVPHGNFLQNYSTVSQPGY